MSMEQTIEKLKKLKKKPEDWIFVPSQKKYKVAHVGIFNGEYTNVVDPKNGDVRKQEVKPRLGINVPQASKLPNGQLIGGYRPKQESIYSAQEVLDAFIKMSLNPSAPVVPYEARDTNPAIKGAELELAAERAARLESEARVRDLEGDNAAKTERLRELEKFIEESTKPKANK